MFHTRANHQATVSERQTPSAPDGKTPLEDAPYLSRQVITCLGNKRALLDHIGHAVGLVKKRLDKPRLRILDAFSGSGVVSRYFKAHAATIIANDIEDYAACVSRCFLRNRSDVDTQALAAHVADLNRRVEAEPLPVGLIEESYAPLDDAKITAADRVFYTRDNARRLDNYRRMIADLPDTMRDLLLGPLLSEASVHANTAGVFKGFYKDRATQVGRFGGSGSDALLRIMGRIELSATVLSRFECEHVVLQDDAVVAARRTSGLDLAYVDPPYNQHPYGSNYFMLNLLVQYVKPKQVSKVSGIPTDWRRSGYNVRARSLPLLRELLEAIDAPFILLSFNDEGFIPPEEVLRLLHGMGRVDEFKLPYNTFRGSRNLAGRAIHVTEHLYLVERT